MKFDFVIGNPPYQDDRQDTSDNKTFMPPVYHLFIDEAINVSDKVMLIHPARFLFNAGQTPKAWNEKMLSDPHYKIIFYEQDASKVFPNTYINGGVVVSYHSKGDVFGEIGVFTAFQELNSILQKIHRIVYQSLGTIVYNQNRFNLESMYSDYPQFQTIIGSDGKDRRFRNNIFEKIPLFSEVEEENSVRVIGMLSSKRTWRYFPKKYIDDKHENLAKFKVIISSADGAAGTVGHPIPARILGEPTVLRPNEGYTQTFIGVGSCNTENEAQAIAKYLKTRFCRVLAGTLKITQHITPETFNYVPLQDFTPSSDIDWSQPIAAIDRQLYLKYGLSEDEIAFIESHVKEMS